MNRAERALTDQLKPVLQEAGFKFKASNLTYKKAQPFGFLYLSLPSFPMPENGGYQVVDVGLGVRHDAVDDIVNELGHIWGDDNRKNTTTVYRSMQHFPFQPERDARKIIRFSHVEQDAETAASSIASMLAADGFGFYDRYSFLLECSRGLNEPIEAQTHPLLNNFPLRAYYGVAAAGLAEPQRVPELVATYADFVRNGQVVDNGVYDVGAGLTGAEAVQARLNFVAERALASH